jgi:hypothetical protein
MKRGFCGGRQGRPPQNPPNSPSPLPLGGRGEGVRGRGEGPGAPKHHPRGCFKKAKLNNFTQPGGRGFS